VQRHPATGLEIQLFQRGDELAIGHPLAAAYDRFARGLARRETEEKVFYPQVVG
jgi:hypothetical protein